MPWRFWRWGLSLQQKRITCVIIASSAGFTVFLGLLMARLGGEFGALKQKVETSLSAAKRAEKKSDVAVVNSGVAVAKSGRLDKRIEKNKRRIERQP